MTIDRFCVYPTGMQLTAAVQLRHSVGEVHPASPWELEHPRRRVEPDEVFRFGVLFSDGRQWTNIDQYLLDSGEDAVEPPSVVLHTGFGSHGPLGWESMCWLWPLPPAGPLTFVVEWPAGGIPETSRSLEVDQLLELAPTSTHMWTN